MNAIRIFSLTIFMALIIACGGTIETKTATQPKALETKPASCESLFVNAKEIDADDYFRKLRNEALDEPYWRDTYWFKADNGKVAKNGPRMTWVYEAALNVALNYVPPAAQEGSFIDFEGRQLLWDNYLAFKQSL